MSEHSGCTIIDINPGVGVWSSKIHELLKPRKHILVEQRPEVFLPFLQPLLNGAKSRYTLAGPFRETELFVPQTYIHNGLIPTVEDCKTKKSPFLIIANFSGQKVHAPIQHGMSPSNANIKLLDLAYHTRHKLGFQAYGPTQVLMWMDDHEKRPLFPRTVRHRTKSAVAIEATLDAEEIAGAVHVDASAKTPYREYTLDAESSRRVAKRTDEEKIFVPPDRQLQSKVKEGYEAYGPRGWHDEFERLDEGFKNGTIAQFVGEPPKPVERLKTGRAKPTALPVTEEYKRWKRLAAELRSTRRKDDWAKDQLRLQEEVDRLDLEARQDGLSADEQKKLLKQVDDKIEELKKRAVSWTPKQGEKIRYLDDDRRALTVTPELLMWDRRKAEPLLVQDDEFYPTKSLALYHLRPRTDPLYPLNPDQQLQYDLLTQLLFSSNSFNLTSLNTIAPGAYDALVPKVPAISDPKKGGRRDVTAVRIRTLTQEMLHALVLAWDKWLFKPPINELLTRTSMDQTTNAKRWSNTFGM